VHAVKIEGTPCVETGCGEPSHFTVIEDENGKRGVPAGIRGKPGERIWAGRSNAERRAVFRMSGSPAVSQKAESSVSGGRKWDREE